MNEIFVTVNGTVGSDITVYQGDRSRRARFRLATAERYFDRERNEWVSRETVWLDVVCWRRLADHVAASLHKGEPVIVRGRLRVSTYESDNGPRQALEVIATSVGHDLAMGRATYTRPAARPTARPTGSPAVASNPTEPSEVTGVA